MSHHKAAPAKPRLPVLAPLLLALGFIALAGCQPATDADGKTAVVVSRYRVSVSVVVGGKTGTGQAVWELTMDKEPHNSGPYLLYNMAVRGEAINIRFDDGENLFALRRSFEGPPGIAFGAFILDCLHETLLRERATLLASFKGGCDARIGRPMIVKIGDPNDVQSIEQIPYRDHLQSDFAIDDIRIHVETTSDEIGSEIEDILPFVSALPSYLSGVGIISTRKYYEEDFTTEIDK